MIRLYTLAGIDLRGPDGRPVRSVLAQPKRLALLVHLVLTTRTASGTRDALLGLFWPEYPPERARRALNQALHYLRRSLGPGVVVSRGSDAVGIAHDKLWCDAIVFEDALAEARPADALAVYRGDLLAGFYIDEAPGFERWLEGARTRLRDGARAAARELAEREVRANDFGRAVPWARRAVEISPHDEGAFRDLIRVLDCAGDRAGALEAFDVLSHRLEAEFGATPAPETLALVQAVRSRSEAAGAVPGDAAWPTTEPRSADDAGTAPDTGAAARAEDPGVGAPADAPSREVEEGRPAGEEVTGPGPVEGETVRPARSARWRRPIAWGTAVVGVALACALLVTAEPGEDGAPVHREAAAETARPRIVVLPFRDLSDGAHLGTVADALSMALANRLAQVPGLEVISSRGLWADAPPGAPAERSPSTLEADVCVAGSVLGSGDSLMIQVELIDADSRVTLWNTRVGRPAGDLFALLDDVSDHLASALRVRLGDRARWNDLHHGAASAEARQLVQRAQRYREEALALKRAGATASAVETLRAADSLLADAEVAAPSWVEPVVLRGWTAADLGWLLFDPAVHDPGRARGAWGQALQHATRALADAPRDAKALELRGVIRYWLWLLAPASAATPRMLISAEADLEHAVAIDTRRIRAWSGLAGILDARGDFAAANVAAQRAYEADAYLENPQQILSVLVTTSLELGEDTDARRWCAELRRRFANTPPAAYCTLAVLAWSVVPPEPAPDEIWRVIDRLRIEPAARSIVRPQLEMLAATILARVGLRDSAQAVIRRAHASPISDAEILWLEAAARTELGDKDVAAGLLTRYIRAYPTARRRILESRIFGPLRDRLPLAVPLDRPGSPPAGPQVDPGYLPPDHPGRPPAPGHRSGVTDSRSTGRVSDDIDRYPHRSALWGRPPRNRPPWPGARARGHRRASSTTSP